MGKNKNDNSFSKIERSKNIMLAVCSFVILGCITLFTASVSVSTDEAMKNKVLQMTAQLNTQMVINLDSYMERIETIGTLAFSDPVNYTYDDTNPPDDEYEALKQRDQISDNLYNICMMENFVDFGIVYSNNSFVGKISNGSLNAFGDDMYDDLKTMISRPSTKDGWSTGFDGNYRRIYYVKEIHNNALLVLSFYSSELSNVFEHSQAEGMESLAVRMTDEENVVVYSSVKDETGNILDDELLSRINSTELYNASMIDDQFLISLNQCDGWKIVCSLPTEQILAEKNSIQLQLLLAAVLTVIFSISVTVFLLNRIFSKRINGVVSVLDDEAHRDLLTGLLNKRSFEIFTENSINTSGLDDKKTLILLDIDNFKGVNDTLGHEYGDRVLSGVGDILRSVFPEGDLLGRLGGDEFCVFLNVPDNQEAESYTETKCSELCKAFANNYTGDDNNYKISASIGCALYPKNGVKFSDLYRRADKALYSSKHRGKDTYTLFRAEMEEETEV